MVHLSEVLGLAVLDADNCAVGKLHDFQIDPMTGLIRYLHVRRGRGSQVYPWSAVEAFSPETRKVELSGGCKPLPDAEVPAELILLARDVLDRQIIDTSGRKVVRVNDVLLEFTSAGLFVRRVEVGLAGAVRRLMAGILSPRLVRHLAGGLSERGISWDFVGLVEPEFAQIRLKVHQQLARMHPADVADILEDLGRMQRKELVSIMDTETAAQALSEVEPSVQATVVEDMQVDHAADLLEEMQPDEAADILGDLSEERSEALLQAMEKEEAEEVRELLSFDDDTAGGLMTTEFFKADPSWTIAETMVALRGADPDLLGEMDEIPLTDSSNRLVGMVPLVRMLRKPPEANVTAAMRRDARSVMPTAPLSEVVERFEKYHLRGLAVTDQFGYLAGLITIEDLLSRLAQRF